MICHQYDEMNTTMYYMDNREKYRGFLYEITPDEEIGAFIKRLKE